VLGEAVESPLASVVRRGHSAVREGSETVPDEQRPPPILEEVRHRRTDLHRALVGVEQAISRPAAGRIKHWTAEVVDKLVQLRDAIDEHMAVTERPGGLYEDIMARAPRLAAKIRRLHNEHPVLREGATELLDRLESTPIGDAWPLDQARDDIQRLLGKIMKHRQLGADLVWEAYNLDIGGTG
jgi:hypothetical protein